MREYLAIDPTGRFVPESARGWRLEGDAYMPWMPDAQGHWQSREIPIAIGVAGGLATVYSGTGERQLHEGEVGAALREAREALAERDRQIARQQVELDALSRPREPERDR